MGKVLNKRLVIQFLLFTQPGAGATGEALRAIRQVNARKMGEGVWGIMLPRSDGFEGGTGQITSRIYINKIVFVCLSVCLSVCLFNPKFLLGKCTNRDILYTNRSTIYLGRTTLPKEICPSNCPDPMVRKSYTGRRKSAKNGRFLEVLWTFNTLCDIVFI